jgi:hypothetical protein
MANDIYGTSKYNQYFGLKDAGQNTLGSFTGNRLMPTLGAFNAGVTDYNEIYRKAGIPEAKGSYSGINNSWVPDVQGDTMDAFNARVSALRAAGLDDTESRMGASAGFNMRETPQDAAARDANEFRQKTGLVHPFHNQTPNQNPDGTTPTSFAPDYLDNWRRQNGLLNIQPQQQYQQPTLQPFQQTQQYQNYMGANFLPQNQQSQAVAMQPFQQQRQSLQSFQSQDNTPRYGGLLGYSPPANTQQNQYGLLNPYASRQY